MDTSVLPWIVRSSGCMAERPRDPAARFSARLIMLPAMNSKAPTTEWVVHPGLLLYPDAVAAMEERAEAIAAGRAAERVWLVEHPPIYTAGTSADAPDLLDARFPVFKTGRGGQFTYHGPGQRVAYVMLDLKRRKPDVRAYVRDLEGGVVGGRGRARGAGGGRGGAA